RLQARAAQLAWAILAWAILAWAILAWAILAWAISGRQSFAEHVQLQVLAAHVIGLDEREYQAAPAIEESQPQQIAAHEAPLGIDQYLPQAAALATVVEGLRHQCGVALHAILMVAEAAVGEVLQVSAQPADGPVHLCVLVDLMADPTPAAPIEQPDQTVRISVAV